MASGYAAGKLTDVWKQWERQVIAGEFPLLKLLGHSERSAVFLTERGEQRHKAAIKLIAADELDANLQISRWNEAAALAHPHLLRIFKAAKCELGDRLMLYVVMEYAEEDLSQILPHRPLSPAECRDMLAPVLDALQYLHIKRLVHGHLKPGNILAVNDQLKISSDGLCGAGSSAGATLPPSVYNAPETGVRIMSPAADIWSLGIIVIEALTQRLPFRNADVNGGPVIPAALPPPFLEISRNCLRLDPERRWAVADISAALQSPSPAPHPVVVPAHQPMPGATRTPSKLRFVAIAAVVVMVLAAILLLPRTSRVTSKTGNNGQAGTQQPAVTTSAQPSAGANSSSPGTAASKASPTGLVAGAVAHEVVPDVSRSARNTITGHVKVRVRVSVDPSGNVVASKFDTVGPSQYFARLAMQAAQKWTFTPPQQDGRNLPSEWVLRFEFGREGTNVVPSEQFAHARH